MRDYTKQYINGEWVESNSNETIEVINSAKNASLILLGTKTRVPAVHT